MPKQKSLRIVGFILAGGLLVAAGMIFFVGPLFEKDTDTTKCSESSSTTPHVVIIKDGKVTPENTQAQKCDKLTIKNDDTVTRLLAFGQHEHHVAYNGVTETNLTPGQSFTVTLNQTGEYLFHDHYDESVSANFTVK